MRFLFHWGTLGLTALLVGAVGCANNPSSPAPAKGQPKPATSSAGQTEATTAPANNLAVTVKQVNWAGFQNTIKGLKGKVVVVDFWQTT